VSQPERWILNQTALLNDYLYHAWAEIADQTVGLAICGVIGLPTDYLTANSEFVPVDTSQQVVMHEVWSSGAIHVYRITQLWIEAHAGDSVLDVTTCFTVDEGNLGVQPYGNITPYPGYPIDSIAVEVTLPAAVYPLATDADPCAALGVTTPLQIPVLYMLTFVPPLPPGVDVAAAPEIAICLSNTGGTANDLQGPALAWSESGLPDWMLFGVSAPDPTIDNFPAGRKTWP
jgi:hypothetical protein